MAKKKGQQQPPAKQRGKTPAGDATRGGTTGQDVASRGRGRAKSEKKKRSQAFYHSGSECLDDDLETELDRLGLRIFEMEGDGNCLFRAIADQAYGRNGDHAALRSQSVRYMRDHKESFEPFIEDDEDFGGYLNRMAKDGQWGGNLELQALSLILNQNINVHQAGQPVWMIVNFPESMKQALNVSYHMGEHYNSVRLKDDDCPGPALSFELTSIIRASSLLETDQESANSTSTCPQSNADACSVANGIANRLELGGDGHNTDGIKSLDVCHLEKSKRCNPAEAAIPKQGMEKTKVPARNRVCPCGSKKKYKSCCALSNNCKTNDNKLGTTHNMQVQHLSI